MQRELEHVKAYKKAWEAAPYPVKHVTVDAVVEQSGHVLVVKRRAEPGKGLLALIKDDGGFLTVRKEAASAMAFRDYLEVVYNNGDVMKTYMFDQVRKNAEVK